MDKTKIIEGAAKLVAKGSYDKALKEYQKVLDADPKDVRVLQKMAELHQKKNDNVEAAKCFTRVAESYSGDGFFLKAVALYKQVLKLSPELLDVNLKLAELHQQLGLMSEATAYFQLVANHYEKQGNTKASLDTLRKMVELDPENVSSRSKLAELYAREGMNKDAVTEFRRVAEFLKRTNRTDDYLRISERISTMEPENVELARELAETYLSRGDQKRALAKLQVCFKADARDVGTLTMLADAFTGLGQTTKTVSVYKELIKVHEDSGRGQAAETLWEKIAQLEPGDPELTVHRRGAVASPATTALPAPASPAAPRAGAGKAPPTAAPPPAASAAPLRSDQLMKLLTETDVYVKYGLHDKALEHLRRVFQVDPENLEAHEKAYHIYVNAQQSAEAGEQLLNVLRLCARAEEVERGQGYLDALLESQPDHPELPTFLAALRPGGAEATPGEWVEEETLLVDAADEAIIVSAEPPDALAARRARGLEPIGVDEGDDAFVLEGDAIIVPEEDSELHTSVEDEAFVLEGAEENITREHPLVDDPALELALGAAESEEEIISLDIDVEATVPDDDSVLEPELSLQSEELSFETEAGSFEDATSSVQEPAVDDDDPVAAELDEAAFFMDQGLLEESREVLETVMIARPGNAKGQALLDRLSELEREAATRAPVEPVTQPVPATPPSVTPVQAAAEPRDAFDLAAELAEEYGEGSEAAAPPAASAEDFQYSVEEVFSEFKKGLQKVVKPEDVETHYDLGIAYKEMGLLDDAIHEFTVALEGCRGKRKEIDCLTMMALLQGAKGDLTEAVASWRRALLSSHLAPDTEKALGYELGVALEATGAQGKALYHFQRVAQVDAAYRDVSAQMARLSAVTKPEEDKPPAGRTSVSENAPPAPANAAATKARKVGYL